MRNAIFFGLWLLFYLLFWQEGFGINLIIFGLSLHITARAFGYGFKFQPGEWPYFLSFLASAFGLMIINSALSIAVFIMVNVAYLSFVWGTKLSVIEHFGHGLLRFVNISGAWLPAPLVRNKGSFGGFFSTLRIVLLPLGIFSLFFILFRAGNPVFKEWSNGFTDWVAQLFEGFSWALFWFSLLGFLLLRMVLQRDKKWPLSFSVGDDLQRGSSKGKGRSFRLTGLRMEYRMALMAFISLNLLLAVVNAIDIKWFWFGFEMPKNFSLKEFLHEGVAYLIATLLLAAAVVFYFFRRNLNFYPNNRILVLLAKAWLIQNGILAISVLLRTFYYIDFHGLADGRIVVITIISIVLAGLILLFLKLKGRKSYAYVFRHVSLYTMLLLASMSLVDWDGRIASFNLNHGRINEIDVYNYLRQHPRVYPMIYEQLDRVERQIVAHKENEHRWVYIESIEDFKLSLGQLRDSFLKREEKEGFGSWNWADAHTKKELSLLKEPESNK